MGRKIANKLKAKSVGLSAVILALTGDLGSGKTTFVQGLAEGLGVKSRIISPTFILLKRYEVKLKTPALRNLFHLDLYRLEHNVVEEVKNLGIEEIWNDPENIVVIEWAEKIKNHIPKDSIWLFFKYEGDEKRLIIK